MKTLAILILIFMTTYSYSQDTMRVAKCYNFFNFPNGEALSKFKKMNDKGPTYYVVIRPLDKSISTCYATIPESFYTILATKELKEEDALIFISDNK